MSFFILDCAIPRAFAPLYSRNAAIVRRQVIFPAEITTRVRVKLSRPKVLKIAGEEGRSEWRKVWHMENGNCRERHDGFLYLLPRLSTEPKPTPAAHSNLASLPALVNACSAISRSLRDARDPSSSVEFASPPAAEALPTSLPAQTILNVCSHFFQRMPRPEDIVAFWRAKDRPNLSCSL